MKGSVWSKLVSACFPSSETGEDRHLGVGSLAYLVEFLYKLLSLDLKRISEAPKNMVNYKRKHFWIWNLELIMCFYLRFNIDLNSL